MARLLGIFGLLPVVFGLAWPFLAKLGLGHLPGDIVVRRAKVTIFVPLATSLLVSVVLSAVLWLLNR
jgi:hypothetical protein